MANHYITLYTYIIRSDHNSPRRNLNLREIELKRVNNYIFILQFLDKLEIDWKKTEKRQKRLYSVTI